MAKEELLALGEELLHPTRGVMRGILSGEADDKLLRMRFGEVRKIARFVSGAVRELDPPVSAEKQP